jgi:glutaconate CoA-transferase subunit A
MTEDKAIPEVGRASKVMDVAEAVASLIPQPCESLWVGGMHMHNVPMALVREFIRQGKRVKTLYAAPSTSLAADLLIGARLVERVVCGYIGFEHLGLAPAFRRAVEEEHSVEVIEADSGSLTLALQAGAWGQPFAPLPPGLDRTDLPVTSPDFYVRARNPFTGEDALAVQAIRPTVALIHCQQADDFGNGIFKGSIFNDHLLALAADTVLMQVENVVSNIQIVKYPQQTGVPAFRVAGVVPVNFGCHPTSSHRYYNYDDVHLRLYLQAASTREGFDQYMAQYVRAPANQDDYMRRVQNQDWSSVQGETNG